MVVVLPFFVDGIQHYIIVDIARVPFFSFRSSRVEDFTVHVYIVCVLRARCVDFTKLRSVQSAPLTGPLFASNIRTIKRSMWVMTLNSSASSSVAPVPICADAKERLITMKKTANATLLKVSASSQPLLACCLTHLFGWCN